MGIKDLFNKKNKKNDYYQYLKSSDKKAKFGFLKSKTFIFISSLVILIIVFILIFQFRTAKRIQKFIFNREYNKAISSARAYLRDDSNGRISFLLAEALFIKSFIVKDEQDSEAYRNESKKIFLKMEKQEKKFSSIELFAYGFLLAMNEETMDKGVDYLKEAIDKNEKDGKLGAYINRRIINISKQPLNFVDIYERIAFALYKLKRYRESIRYYKAALKIRPKTIHYFFLALINKKLENFKRASKYITLVLNNEKNEEVQAKCYFLMANIEFKRENFKKAEKFYKKTLEFNSQSANSYYFLGKIYRKQKKLKKYRKYLKEAARLGHKKARTMFPSYELKEIKKRQAYRR